MSVLRSVAVNELTVLLALNLGNVIAPGLVIVNKLPPSVVAPKLVLAVPALVKSLRLLDFSNLPLFKLIKLLSICVLVRGASILVTPSVPVVPVCLVVIAASLWLFLLVYNLFII
jgi:hypothetical protein